MNKPDTCFCGNNIPFSQCCQPVIKGEKHAPTAEQLMRSRYAAYVTGDYGYIAQTYSQCHNQRPCEDEIRQHAAGTIWLGLNIIESSTVLNTAMVEFKALYQHNNQVMQLHERSTFVIEQQQWRYAAGDILPDSGPL